MRKPHRGRGGSRHVGRVRVAAAKILTDGLGFTILPEDIQPATGSWRTDWRNDVYRWEVYGYTDRPICRMPFVAGCWERLADFVKAARASGFHVSDQTIYPGRQSRKT